MPKWRSASTNAARAAVLAPGKLNANSPLAPRKSRTHRAWPGQSGLAGCSIFPVHGWAASQSATANPLDWCRAIRTSSVRSPRSASAQSSGETAWPK